MDQRLLAELTDREISIGEPPRGIESRPWFSFSGPNRFHQEIAKFCGLRTAGELGWLLEQTGAAAAVFEYVKANYVGDDPPVGRLLYELRMLLSQGVRNGGISRDWELGLGDGKRRLTICLPPAIDARIRQEARDGGITISERVLMILEKERAEGGESPKTLAAKGAK